MVLLDAHGSRLVALRVLPLAWNHDPAPQPFR